MKIYDRVVESHILYVVSIFFSILTVLFILIDNLGLMLLCLSFSGWVLFFKFGFEYCFIWVEKYIDELEDNYSYYMSRRLKRNKVEA